MIRAFARSSLIVLLNALLVCFIPFMWFARLLARHIRPGWHLSIWTGEPIITVAKNCRVERLLGFDSRSLVRRSYYLTQDFDYDLSCIIRGNRFLGFLAAYVALAFVCVLAEQVHAYMDGGILPSRKRRQFNPVELWFYRLLGIRLLIWSYGGDVRTRTETLALGEPNCCTDCDAIGQACICDSNCAKENLERIRTTATTVFAMGDMVEYVPGSRNDLYYWPIDLAIDGGARYRPVYPVVDAGRPLRVLHAPNHRQFKGTKFLEAAVAVLRLKGVAIELVLVENVPNIEAIEIYRTADIIFDQCLIGFHGYFALEAMALGKPVVCYIRDKERYLLAPAECPIINIHADSLAASLEYWATEGRGRLEEVGRRSRWYIERHYTKEAFAARLAVAYRDLGIGVENSSYRF